MATEEEQKQFLENASKPIEEKPEGGQEIVIEPEKDKQEPESQKEQTPAPEGVTKEAFDTLQQKYTALEESIKTQETTIVPDKPIETIKQEVMNSFKGIDALEEGFGEKADQVTKAMIKEAVDKRMAVIENVVYGDRYSQSKKNAETIFGERINVSKDEKSLNEMQENLSGLAFEDAHRIRDYDNLYQENQQLKAGNVERQNVQTLEGGAASRNIEQTEKVTVTLDEQEVFIANRLGGDLQKTAKVKLKAEKEGGYYLDGK